jgi:hypothetical protein
LLLYIWHSPETRTCFLSGKRGAALLLSSFWTELQTSRTSWLSSLKCVPVIQGHS